MRSTLYPSLVGALLLGGCAPVGGGKMSATSTGDLSHALVERSAPTREQQQCGTGALTALGARRVARAPYLQRVSSTSALVLFTLDNEPTVPAVSLTLPTGAPVQTVPAEQDTSIPSGLQWMATFTGLEPDRLYCYSLDQLSERAGFRTAPAPFVGASTRFVVFGDSGRAGARQDAVKEQLHTVPFDLMLHTGDVVYGDASLARYEEDFFDPYAELLKSVPVFPTSGNHEYQNARGAPYREVFALPENGGAEGVERWYSFDWGDVHFVALDTEQLGDAQRAWLTRDLASSPLPWKIVYLHRPPYSSGYHGSSRAVRDAFSRIFMKHGVQVVFAGHDHDYERTKVIDGVTYIVTGGGGHSTRRVGHSAFTAFSEDVLHFVYAEVQGDAMLLHAIDATGREFDSVRIPRLSGAS